MATKKQTPEVSDNASAPAAQPEKKKPTLIRYIGTADVKILGDLTWNSQNEHTIPVEAADESTLEYLRSQPDFRFA